MRHLIASETFNGIGSSSNISILCNTSGTKAVSLGMIDIMESNSDRTFQLQASTSLMLDLLYITLVPSQLRVIIR